MSKCILGIDLGTSSVKLLMYSEKGFVCKSKAGYTNKTPQGFLDAVKRAASEIDLSVVDAIGLSSQVGTYIVNNEDIIPWNCPVGKDELDELKAKYSTDKFISELAMPHPDIISYPLPRLMYIKKNFGNIKSICQPKDYLCMILTGNNVTDKYSMRGLVNTAKGKYSEYFLNEFGIDKDVLPKVVMPEDMAGITTKSGEALTGIPAGIPVFTGLNDFFASLVGMGISESGDMFDITGTSEHLGVICDNLQPDTKLVSGGYFDKFIHYGVTASSGASLDFGMREFGFDGINIDECLKNNPPIFTPYVNGERAPIFSSDARGMFFGINSSCTKKELAYSVLEGVAFSIYHIYDSMNSHCEGNIKVSGGAAKSRLLNTIKAELFGKKIYTLAEPETSSLGAIRIAAKGLGMYDADYSNKITDCIEPCGKYRDVFLKRFDIYVKLYTSLENEFNKFANLRKDMI